MKGSRNSRCSVKSLNCFLLVMPLLSRLPSTSLPPFHSSALVPSKRTTAAVGGLAFRLGLLRTTRPRSNGSLPCHLPVSLPSPRSHRSLLSRRTSTVSFSFFLPSQ